MRFEVWDSGRPGGGSTGKGYEFITQSEVNPKLDIRSEATKPEALFVNGKPPSLDIFI